ncbi:MAG: hypothetical protein MHM6MM_007483 [Cercozoa sp. M6MM]
MPKHETEWSEALDDVLLRALRQALRENKTLEQVRDASLPCASCCVRRVRRCLKLSTSPRCSCVREVVRPVGKPSTELPVEPQDDVASPKASSKASSDVRPDARPDVRPDVRPDSGSDSSHESSQESWQDTSRTEEPPRKKRRGVRSLVLGHLAARKPRPSRSRVPLASQSDISGDTLQQSEESTQAGSKRRRAPQLGLFARALASSRQSDTAGTAAVVLPRPPLVSARSPSRSPSPPPVLLRRRHEPLPEVVVRPRRQESTGQEITDAELHTLLPMPEEQAARLTAPSKRALNYALKSSVSMAFEHRAGRHKSQN